jgi:hypothetical protein
MATHSGAGIHTLSIMADGRSQPVTAMVLYFGSVLSIRAVLESRTYVRYIRKIPA